MLRVFCSVPGESLNVTTATSDRVPSHPPKQVTVTAVITPQSKQQRKSRLSRNRRVTTSGSHSNNTSNTMQQTDGGSMAAAQVLFHSTSTPDLGQILHSVDEPDPLRSPLLLDWSTIAPLDTCSIIPSQAATWPITPTNNNIAVNVLPVSCPQSPLTNLVKDSQRRPPDVITPITEETIPSPARQNYPTPQREEIVQNGESKISPSITSEVND